MKEILKERGVDTKGTCKEMTPTKIFFKKSEQEAFPQIHD